MKLPHFKTCLTAIALSLFPIEAITAPVLFVDFGQNTSAPLQSGYEAFTPWAPGNSADNGNPVTQAYNSSDATDGTIEVTMAGMTHWRDYAGITGGPYASKTSLLSDMALRNGNGTMTLTIADLKPGDYFIKTYHFSNGANPGHFSATVSDANRTDASLGTFIQGPRSSTPSTVLSQNIYFTITDGDFVLKLTRTGGQHMDFNGFELSSVTAPAITSTFPLDNESQAWAENGNIKITFDQDVFLNGTGSLSLKNLTAGTQQVLPLSTLMPSEYSPAALSGLNLWLDANDSSTITHSSNSVSQWSDKSGQNNHATQGSGSSKPAYNATDANLNNKPSISSSSATGSVGFNIPTATLKEIYFVAYYKDGSDNTFDGYNTLISGPGSNGLYRVMGNINTADWITSSRFNDAGTFLNGATSASNTVLPLPASILRIGSTVARTEDRKLLFNSQASDRGWIGGVGEVIGLSSTASTSDRQDIEGYLAHKWGLTASLPAGHPYKSSAPPAPSIIGIGNTLAHDFGSLSLNSNYAVQLSANAIQNSSSMLETNGITDDTTLNFTVSRAAKQAPGLTNLVDEALPTGTDAKITFNLDSGERLFSALSPSLHFDASDLGSITKDGSNKVTQWNDISGNSRNATLTAGVPTYSAAGGPNGMPYIKFSRSGGDDYMDLNGTFFVKDHYYVVRSPDGNNRWDNYGGVLGHQSGRGSNYLFQSGQPYFHNNRYPAAVGRNGATLASNFNMTDVRQWMVVRLSVDSTSTTPKSNYRIGRNDGYTASFDIAEIIAFESDLPTSSREQLEGHLAHKWGLSNAFDASHAFSGTVASPFGALTTSVTIYYGKTDAGNSWGAWESNKLVGASLSSGTVQDTLTGLEKETQYFYRIRSNNGAHESVSQTESFTTPDGIPYLPSPVTIYGKKGQAISHDLDASILGIWTGIAATGLPAGLSLNTSTGVIEGSPIGGGSSDVTITVTGDSGSSQQTYTIKIVDFDQFAHTFPITTSGYTGSETLTDFPLLVRLGTSLGTDFSYSGFLAKGNDGKSTGHDLRIYLPSGQELAYEIEEWNQDGVSKVWVQIPSLTSSTQIILAWGNPAQTTLPVYAGDGSVWSNAYSAVYHMGAPQLGKQLDSSPYSFHADDLGLVAGDSNNELIGPHLAQGSGSSGSMETATATALDDVQEGSYTLSAWTRRENNDGFTPNAFLARGYNNAHTSSALERDTMIADINPLLDFPYTQEKIWNSEDLEFTSDNHLRDAGIGLSYTDHMGFVAFSTFIVPETGAYRFKANLSNGNCRSSGWLDLNKDGKFDISEKLGSYSGNDWETATINLTAGDRHDFALIYRHFNGGANFTPYIQTPSIAYTKINPAAANQAGFWEVNPNSYWGTPYSPLGVLQKGNFGFVIDPSLKLGFKHSTTEGIAGVSGTTATTTNQWNHLAATVDKATGQVRLYLDGVLEASGAFTAGASATEMGAAPFTLSSSMQSSYDEVRIASTPRSADWIKAVFDSQKASPSVLSYGTMTGPPVFTSPLIVSTDTGQAFSYQMSASQSPTAYVAYNLPDGLTVDSAGLISGTPTTAGTYPILLLAQYSDGSVLGSPSPEAENAVTLQLTINAVAPSITTEAASAVAASAANLNGEIQFDGGSPVSVIAYFGKSDGGTDTSAWESSQALGLVSGTFSYLLAGLNPNTAYHYRLLAINSASPNGVWSASSQTFTTLTSTLPLLSHGNLDFNTDNVNLTGSVDFVGNGTLAGAIPQSFSHSHLTGDADSGVSNSHTYTCAVNVNGVDKVVNGVTFKGETGTSGTGWTFTAGFTSPHGSQATNVGGVIGEVLANGMRYNGDPQKIKLTGLTDGQHYVFSLYSQAWEASGRVATITCTDTPDVLTIDQSKYGGTNPEGLLVECRFTASGTEAEFTIDPVGGTWHLYAFSNREAASGPVYPDYTGVELTLYWGTSDGGTDASAWDSAVAIGNYYGLQEVDGFESRGWNMPYNATLKGFPTSDHWFDVNIEDLIAIPSDGQKIIFSEPNNVDGFYFNGDNDFINAGIGITQNDNYTDIHQTYFTPQESGNFTFRMDERDDLYAMWMDLNQDGVFVKDDGDFLGGPTSVNKTVSLQQGQQYKFLILHGEGGGGSKFRAWVDTPSLTDRVIKPLDPDQAGFYKWKILSTGKFIEEQANTVANLPGLASGSTYYYRLKGTNSLGTSWAPATDSFVFENKLDFDYGTLTFDTTAATWSHTSGKSGSGTIVTGSATTPEGDTLSYKKTEYKFDSIRLAGNLQVVLKGDNALSLQTINNGDIDILVDLDASGGNATGADTGIAGIGGPGDGGRGVLGGGHGADMPSGNHNWGNPGGDPRNIVGASVNGGGAYLPLYKDANGVTTRDNVDTRGERGAGGSYAGKGTGGYWSGTSYLIAGETYGEPTLSALLAGSGGSSQGRNGSCTGGAGGGAIEILAHGTGSVTIGAGKSVLVDGGDVPNHYSYGNPANQWYYGSGGGGSGGAIRIEGQNVNVYGTLSATGGDRYWNSGNARGGAGGGGRIALFARNNLVPGNILLRGGLDRSGNKVGGKGSLYVESATGGMSVLDASTGVVTIDSDLATLIYNSPSTSGFAIGTPQNQTVQIDGADYLLEATKFTFDRINIAGSAVLSITGTKPVILATRNHGDIVFNSSVSLDGNAFGDAGAGGFAGGKGESAGTGPGAGSVGIGGSYGGPADGASLVDTYGNATLSELFGGSGGGGVSGGNGGGGGGALAVIAHGAGTITVGNNVTISARGGNSDSGPGAGGGLYFEADEIINNGSILATGGKPETVASTANGGGGRIALKTNKAVAFGTIDAGNGTLSVIGDMGIQTLNYDTGSLVFDTGSASWYHSSGQHGQGTLVDQYGFSGINLPAAVFSFAGINLGHDLTITVRGQRALVLKDTSGNPVLIRPTLLHQVAASGISIETDGDLTVGRDYGSTNTVGSSAAGFTLQLRGQNILNKAVLKANGIGSRLVMGYPGTFTNQGTLTVTERIDVTLPSITNTLTAEAPYGATIVDPIAKDDLTAWFRFDENEGTRAYSEMGGFFGDFVGTDGSISPVVHFDASNFASITKDGSDKVTQWNDLSGNSRNATLGSGVPTYFATGGSNNMPYIQFLRDGGDDWMDISGTFFAKDHYYVIRNPKVDDKWDDYGGILGYQGSRNSNYLFEPNQPYFHHNRLPSAVSRNGVVLTSSTPYRFGLSDTREWMVVRLSVDTVDTSPKNNYKIGRNDNQMASFEVAEILAFPNDLPPVDQNKVEGYLAHKWGVTLTAGHPYENAAPANFTTNFQYNGQPEFAAGKFGNALLLNGGASVAGGWLQTNAKPSDLSVGGDKPRTISFWVKPTEKFTEIGKDYAGMYGMGSMQSPYDSPYMGLGRFNTNNQDTFHVYANNGYDGARANAWKNTWVHFTHRFDGNNQVRTQQNNSNQDNYTRELFTDSGNNSELTIGLATSILSQRTPSRGFVGLIDDFRVYDRYLSDTEVSQLYNNGEGDGATAQPVVKVLTGDQGADRYTATGLPAGLTLNSATGRITGSSQAVGDHNVTIRAGNFLGYGDPQTLVISVLPIAPTMGVSSTNNIQGSSAVVEFNVNHNGGEDVDVSIAYNKNPMGWRYTQLTGDADSGISSSHTYTAAVNVKGPNVTINGVPFVASGDNASGTGWQITSQFGNRQGGTNYTTPVTGSVKELLLKGYRDGGDPQKLKMKNLTPGQNYIFSLYSQAWETSGRTVTLSGTDTNDVLTISQNKYGNSAFDGLLVECLYTATGTEAEFVFDPHSGSTWRLSGFSNREATAADADTVVNLAGTYGNGSHLSTLSGLDVDSLYFFRVTGSNRGGQDVATISHFKTEASLGPPVVTTEEATNIAGTTLTVNGKILSFDGNDDPVVTLYYDSEDKGATSSGWANSVSLGAKPLGDFSGNLTGLTPGTTYFYRYGATNAAGTSYSKSGAFATLGAPTLEGAIATEVSANGATINVRVTSIGGYSYTTYPGLQTDSIKENELAIWFDASALTFADGEVVNFWPDSSGKQRSMPNMDGDPTFVLSESTANNKPVVAFDGNDRLYTSHSFRSGSNLTVMRDIGYTAFGISRYTGGDNERVIQSNQDWMFGHDGGQTGRYHFQGWVDSTNKGGATDFHIFVASHEGKTQNSDPRAWTWTDGIPGAIGHNGSNNDWYMPDRIHFGAKNSATDRSSKAQVAEFIMYEGQLPEVERLKIEGYLAHKYGLPMPNSHPWKTEIPFPKTITGGGDPVNVVFYWGDDDAGTDATAWDQSQIIDGTQGLGLVSLPLTGLTKGTQYFYTAKVTNSAGTVWAPVKTFTPANTLLGQYSIPDLALWLDSTDVDGNGLTDSLADGTALDQWTDKSVLGNHATQLAGSSARPTYVSQAVGTKGGVRFDGLNDNFFIPQPIRDTAGGVSVYALFARAEKQDSGGNSARLLGSADFDIITANGNASGPILYSLVTGSKRIQNLKLGREDSTSANYYEGDLLEVLLFTRQLTLEEQQKTEGYLVHKWGLADTLSDSHPYREFPPAFDNNPKITPKDYIVEVGTTPAWGFKAIKDNEMAIWLDASSLDVADGDEVNQWFDISGKGRHMLYKDGDPVMTSSEPTANNQPVVTFDGDDRLRIGHNFRGGSSLTKIRAIGYSALGVSRYNGATKRRVISSHGGNYIFGHHGGQTGRFHFDGWIDSTNDGGIEDFHVFVSRHEGKDVNSNPRGWTWTDGVQGANGHQGSNNDWYMPQHLSFGAQGSATQESSTCQVAEFVMFYGELNDTDRLKAEAYLAHKYGVGLPGGHVYENGVPYDGEYNPVLYAGVPNTYQIDATNGPESYAESGELAARGLTLDTTTGLVTGVPNALGDFSVTITVSNSSGSVSKDFFFSVVKGTRVLEWDQVLPALTYGDDPLDMTATSIGAGDITYTSNDTSILTVSDSTLTIVGSGTTDVTVNAPATALTNAATPITRSISVAKANIHIKAQDASRLVGQANPSFTYLATGFVNGDTSAVITTAPTITPTDGSGNPIPDNSNTVGSFDLIPSAADALNYLFTYENGVFTVDNRTTQTVTWSQDLSGASLGDTVDLSASSTSSLPVTFTTSDESVAKLVVTRDFHLGAWWKLDEDSGTQGADHSGNNRLLASQGNPAWGAGKFGNALSFDGTNDQIGSFGYKGITGTDKRTYAFWIKTSATSRGILFSGAASGAGMFAISLDGSGNLNVDYGNGSILSNAAINNDEWRHIAVTLPISGTVSQTKIYIDGADATGTATNGANAVSTSSLVDLTLGKDGSTYFLGALDDFRVYEGELDASEVSSIYNQGYGDFNRIRIVGAGPVTLTAQQPGSATFAPSNQVSQALSIGKQDQTLSFASLPDQSVGDFDFDPGATSSSGLIVTYQSSNPDVAQIVGIDSDNDGIPDPGTQKIRPRAAGSAIITAVQAGDANFNAAPSIQQSITVNYFNLFEHSIAGMQWWFDANNVDADTNPDVKTDQSAFFNWNDKSSNNRNAVQATSANMPVYNANGLSNKATILFDADDTLNLPSTSGTKMIFVVIKQDASQTATTSPFGGDLVGTTSGGNWGIQRTGATMLDSGVASSEWAVVVLKADAGAYAIYVNGEEKATGTDATGIAALDKIGGTLKGEIAEAVAYDRVLPGLTRKKIEAYLAHKWGLVDGLPNAHPHKLSRPTFGGAQEIVFQPLPDKTPESPSFRLLAESSSGLPVTFASLDTSIATVSGDIVTPVAEGVVTIVASQAGDSNWFPADNATQQLNVTAVPRSDQVITFNPLPDKQIGDPAFDLTASSNSGLTITYTSTNTGVATIDGNTVTLVGQGVTTIRASQDGDDDWNPAIMVEQELQVTKRNQAITFNPLSSVLLSAGTYTLSATSDSGLSPTFQIDDTSVATVSGNTLTLVAGGSAQVTAIQEGNITYNPADPVSQTLTVVDDTLQPQVITFNQDLSGKALGDPDFALTATVDSGLTLTYTSSNTAVAEINGNTVTIKGAGTTTITVQQPGNESYQAAQATKQLVIAKASQTITFPVITDKVAGGLDFLAGASASSGLEISYTSSDPDVAILSNDRIILKGAGSVTITASQSGNDSYHAATDVTRSFNVTQTNFFATSYPGLSLWLDAHDINADRIADQSSDFLTGGKINTWKDRSGNGFDATQADLAKMPTFQANAQNGLPVVDFSNSALDLPSLFLQGSNDRSIFIVGKSTQGPFLSTGKELPGQRMTLGRDPVQDKLSLTLHGPGGKFIGSSSVANMSISSAILKGDQLSDFKLAVNGTHESAIGNVAVDTQEDGNNRIGANLDGNGRLQGQIAEILVFDSALTDTMVAKVEAYLAIKWGLRTFLPAGHPYKSVDPAFGGSQTITFPAISDQYVSTGTLVLNATTDAGLPNLIYTSSDPTVFSIAGDVGTILQPGTVTVTASHPGDAHFAAAADQTRTFTITKEDQTIVFPAPANMNFMDPDIQLSATATSGLPITFTVTSGPAAIKPGTTDILTLTGAAGNVTITASQNGNIAYNAATPVTRTLYVDDKIPQVIDFKAAGEVGSRLRNFQLGHRPFLIPIASITGGSSGNPVQLNVTGGTAASGARTKVITKPDGRKFFQIHVTSAGTLQLTATQAGGTNGGQEYSAASPVTRQITVRPHSKANFLLSMRDDDNYSTKLTKFQSRYSGRTNPDTGSAYTNAEMLTLFESDAGDPDGDGMSNFLEYAFGGDSFSRGSDERKYIPRKKSTARRTGGSQKFQMTFARISSASDPNLTYTVETSTDMVNWTSVGVTEVSSVSIDGGMEYVTVELDKAFTDADAPMNQFIRVNVTSTE